MSYKNLVKQFEAKGGIVKSFPAGATSSEAITAVLVGFEERICFSHDKKRENIFRFRLPDGTTFKTASTAKYTDLLELGVAYKFRRVVNFSQQSAGLAGWRFKTAPSPLSPPKCPSSYQRNR